VPAQDWLPWISLLISLGVPLAIFVGRNWIKARIQKGVQHGFDLKIEEMQAGRASARPSGCGATDDIAGSGN
jgi:hypothetical protein